MGSIGGYDSKMDKKALLANKPSIQFSSKEFTIAASLDAKNEKRPGSPSSSGSTKSSNVGK